MKIECLPAAVGGDVGKQWDTGRTHRHRPQDPGRKQITMVERRPEGWRRKTRSKNGICENRSIAMQSSADPADRP
jgi:hypothetical protein